MKITKRGEYALRTMLALAMKSRTTTPLSLRQISEEEKMPVKFLEQIMMTLKKAGFVQSTKGKHGGYILSRPASKIKLGEVIRVIDGPLSPLETGEEIREKIQKEERISCVTDQPFRYISDASACQQTEILVGRGLLNVWTSEYRRFTSCII